MTTQQTTQSAIICTKCQKEVKNGYLSRHAKYCGNIKVRKYDKEKARDYYMKNADKIKEKYDAEKKKEYYQKNKEMILDRQKAYIEKNKDKLREKIVCEFCNQSVSRSYLVRHKKNCFMKPNVPEVATGDL